MSIVWINPVVASMYDTHVLDEFLEKYGHKRVETKGDWGEVVKEKYRQEVCETKQFIADVRCPKVKALLKEMENGRNIKVPEIEPILIHCGKEISRSSEYEGEEKIITTPCRALADMGNALGLEDTQFVPWNMFLRMTGEEPEGEKLMESPIPPGFFESLQLNVISFTGEAKIIQGLRKEVAMDTQIVEMLFCEDGCHNGDGIWMDDLI